MNVLKIFEFLWRHVQTKNKVFKVVLFLTLTFV